MKLYSLSGYWWLGATVNGRLYLCRRVGKVGDCIRP